ncbi:MAG: two-component system sensor histidine kinase AlgZ [Gammaproteobacteria bacterium]|jgi:two-component system sensor histidine kinase AlgZ
MCIRSLSIKGNQAEQLTGLRYACSAATTNQSKMPEIPENKMARLQTGDYLPNFCDADVFLRLLLVLELIAIVFALVSFDGKGFYFHLAMISLITQWIGLTVAGLLCLFNQRRWIKSALSSTLVAIGVTAIITILVSLLSYSVIELTGIRKNQAELEFLLIRNLSVSLILIGLALRYFYLQAESLRNLDLQAQTRLQALQARIRPHFLFNSMNTIASLTHDQPDLAEQAIENLSDLFRASLAAEASITLSQELDLTRRYIAIEALRLGDRLTIKWDVPSQIPEVTLPALTLQPLVENAIYHGIEPLPEGGEIAVVITSHDAKLIIQIRNPVSAKMKESGRQGNQMAIENIRERMLLAFNGAADMQVMAEKEQHTVTLEIPLNGLENKR